MPSHSIFLIPGETVHHAPNADLSCPVPWYRPAQSKDSSYGMHTVEFLTSEEGICAANPKYTLPAASPLRISPNHPRGYVQPNLNTCSLRHLHCAYLLTTRGDMCSRTSIHALCGIFTAHIPSGPKNSYRRAVSAQRQKSFRPCLDKA